MIAVEKEEIIEILIMMKGAWMMVGDTSEDLEATKVGVQALDAAISALKGPTREQVEKVWRGEWNEIKPGVLKPNASWICRCAKCGCPQDYKHNFCPNCGVAQTDQAVDMTMERLKEVQNA